MASMYYQNIKKVLNFLKNHKVDIALLQETHLTDREQAKLIRQWQGQVFYASFTSQLRGVATLIVKKCSFACR